MPDFGMGQLSQFSNFIWNMIGQTVSSVIDDHFSDIKAQRAFKRTKELIDYQNEYNSPTQQMQRLSAAGLNPNLVYGSAAPAGTSGNASVAAAPSGNSRYDTADLSGAMLQARQMQALEAERSLYVSQAEKNRADARYTNMQADRYNELLDKQIEEASQRISESASRIGLNSSTEQLQAAQRTLANAEEAYRRGEIGLQDFRRAEIVAQTNLYRSAEALNRTKDYYTDIEGQISVLELDYKKLLYDGERMKELSTAEYEATMKKLQLEAERVAATLGIEGNKAAQWSKWIIDRIASLLGGAASGAGAAAIKAGV